MVAGSTYVHALGRLHEVSASSLSARSLLPHESVVVLRYFDETLGRQDLDSHLMALESQLTLGPQVARRWTVSMLGLMGSARDALHVVHVIERPQLLFVAVAQVGRLPTPWDPSVPSLTPESVRSMVVRHMRSIESTADWSRIVATLTGEMTHASSLVINATSDSIVRTLADEGPKDPASESREHGVKFQHAVAARVRLQRAMFLLRHEGVLDDATPQLESAISGADATISALAAVTSVQLREQIERSNDARLVEAVQAENRDRLIARIGAALLLPSVWFSYLGMNLLPSSFKGVPLQTWSTSLVVAVVGLLLACLGWLLAGRVAKNLGSKEKDT